MYHEEDHDHRKLISKLL